MNTITYIPQPSVEEVEYWLNKWDSSPDYTEQEAAIYELFHGAYSYNENLQHILIKCSVLNDFYSTNIFKVYSVATHIQSLHIDKRLAEGDLTLVNDVARVEISGKSKNFYSFASKYCSHHNQDSYPIYDSYVDKMLKYFKKKDSFAKFENDDLRDYPKFVSVVKQFRTYYGLEKYNLKDLDRYLWQAGKKYFNKY